MDELTENSGSPMPEVALRPLRRTQVLILNGWAASEHAWDLCTFRRDRIFSYVDQLDGLPEHAVAAAESVVLVGWSMGASSALRLACRFPEKIRGLVLVAATARMMKDDGWAGMSERRLAALETGLKMTHGESFFGISDGRPNPYMMDSDENLARGLDYLRTTDIRAALAELGASGRIDCPVAIFQSERDGIVRPANAVFLKTIFPKATMTMVQGSEHALPVAIPELIDAAVGSMNK